MTPLHERLTLREHLERVMYDAGLEIFAAACLPTEDMPLREAAARLPDDHPAIIWFSTVTLGLEYRNAIAEREGWPSLEEDRASNAGIDAVRELCVRAFMLALEIEHGDTQAAANVLRHMTDQLEKGPQHEGTA